MKTIIPVAFCILSFSVWSQEVCRQSGGDKNCLLEKGVREVNTAQKNLLGKKLMPCSFDPMTGYSRSGFCEFFPSDRGRHLVCAAVTKDFLTYTAAQGNDLSTPNPRYGFKGLSPGDRWCLCSSRVEQAINAGIRLRVIKEATHEKAWAP